MRVTFQNAAEYLAESADYGPEDNTWEVMENAKYSEPEGGKFRITLENGQVFEVTVSEVEV